MIIYNLWKENRMIKNIYILKDDGTFLYTHDYTPETIDKQILLGFIMSTVHFSKEAFSGIIRRIEVPNGQLVTFRENYTKIIVSVLSSENDDIQLIQHVLEDVFDKFLEKFGKQINSEKILEESKSFDPILSNLLSHRTKKRSYFQNLIGFGIALLLMIPLALLSQLVLMNMFTTYFTEVLSGSIHNTGEIFVDIMVGGILIVLIYVLIMVPIPSFIVGYFAGTKRRGMVFSLLFLLIMNLILLSLRDEFYTNAALLTIVNLPMVLILSLMIGLTGGWLREKRMLFG